MDDRKCSNCSNTENCAKHAWMRCKNLENWVPIILSKKPKEKNVRHPIEELMDSTLPKPALDLRMSVKVDGKLYSDTNESILHAFLNKLPITFDHCYVEEKADESNTYEVCIEAIKIAEDLVPDKIDLPEADERLKKKEKENVWDNINDFLTVLRAIPNHEWGWAFNPNCKYVELRVDMRDGGCIIRNRFGQRIDPEHLRYQYVSPSDKKTDETNEVHRFVCDDETNEMLKEMLHYLETELIQTPTTTDVRKKITALLKKREKLNLDYVEK
jgi:hypothetical protein